MNSKAIVCWILFALYCFPALSATDKVAANTATPVLAAKVIIGLTLVVLLIIAFAWFAKRLGYFSFSAQQCQMKIIGTLPLGTREKAIMIEAAGKLILLGVTPGGVNNLYTYSEEEKVQALNKIGLVSEVSSTSAPVSFSQMIKQIVGDDRGAK